MASSSDRSVQGSATSIGSSHIITANSATSPSSSELSLARRRTDAYMSTKNGGGDPVTALALRPSPSTSATDRQAQVKREMEASMSRFNKTQ
ncbi:hypothetical protein PG990_004085 [Apiospora arundinis]